MANAWRIGAMALCGTIIGWFFSPIIVLLLNKILSHLGFDASRKLRDLRHHSIPKMKQLLRDIEEQRMQRKARKERSAVVTLDELAKDVKSALHRAEDILDLIDYHKIEKDIVGNGECESDGSGCSWLGRRVQQILYGRFMQDTLHRSAALLPISCAPSASFVQRHRRWWQSKLIWAASVTEMASSYRNRSWSYDEVPPTDQEDGIAEDSFLPTVARWKLRKRIEELENIVTDAQKSHLLNQQSSSGRNDIANMNRRSIKSRVTRKVFGRDRERDMIRIMLREGPDDDAPNTSSSKCYSVICIYGIAGSGKTTLAQYVCEKEDEDKYFDTIMLIHVSETFRLDDILHDMLEQITQDPHSNIKGCEALEAKLVEKLRGRRFLLVLDDLWVKDENQQDLEELLSPFNVGKRGSRVLVTSRNKEAALGSTRHIAISDLDEMQYFSMFMHYALDSSHSTIDDEEYIPIGRKIARKLHRSPIAAITVAGQLRRNPDIKFWETTAKLDVLNKTKGALWWSYQQLDVDVRRCFEYCNIFPRRYELERDMLVHMWIAQGFVKAVDAREEEDVEDVGQDYFHDLHSCGFLQLKRKARSDIDSGEYFTVHDLLHDLAEEVAGSDCLRINRVMPKIPKHVRHLCIESYSDVAFPEQILMLGNLSTLIMCYSIRGISQEDFKRVLIRLRKLRVVQLDIQWLGRIPACIGQLKHLRYLGISGPPPRNMTLPAEFTKLYHLQELSVPPNTLLRCSSEGKMANLVSLRRMLTWHGLNFPNIGKLTSLEALHHFYVRNEEGYEIQQLEQLNNLRGKLFIECLELVKSKEEAFRARLSDKKHLTELTLRWGGIDENSRRKQKAEETVRKLFFPPVSVPEWTNCHQSCSPELEAEVLEDLRPPPQIAFLCIRGYGGQRYPSWLSGSEEQDTQDRNSKDVPDLQCLMFWDCNGSPTPPKIGEFFIRLHTLTISGCSWTSLPENLGRLASLKELNIQECPNIQSLPTLPRSITNLVLAGCNRSLTSSCQTEGHHNWRKIRHITEKLIV